MSNLEKGFISDIFGTEPSEDVRQTLEYNLVKSYPSVNSSNGGQIHSEENVRWLTRQFTKKPFIIQYDDNDMQEFEYQGAVLNAGTTTGGMVNIDGYIINTAEDITKISFDNTKDTMLGTGDNYGYIYHQLLQKAISSFIYGADVEEAGVANGFQSSNIDNYLGWVSNWQPSDWEEEKQKLLKNYLNDDGSYVFEMVGAVRIRYTGDLYDYITNNVDISYIPDSGISDLPYIMYKDVHSQADPPYIDIVYKVNYGYTYEKLKFVNKETDTTKSINYEPILFVKDIFGLTYIYQADLTVSTNSYPGQFSPDINFLNDTVTPTTNQADERIIRRIDKMYDMSKMYKAYTDENVGVISYTNGTMGTITKQIPGTTSYITYPAGKEVSSGPDSFDNFKYDLFMDQILDANSKALYTYTLLTTTDEPSDWNNAEDKYFYKQESSDVVSFREVASGTAWVANTYYKKTVNTKFVNFVKRIPISSETDLINNNAVINDIGTNIFNSTLFDIVPYADLFTAYGNYEGVPVTAEIIQESSFLKSICDSYYCLPLNNINSQFQEIFCTKYPNSSTFIPVGFIASNGSLMAYNVQYNKEVSGVTTQNVLVEGYGTLLRRICKLITKYDGLNTYKGQDISDPNTDTLGWRMLIKDMQTGVIESGSSGTLDGVVGTVCNIFGTNSLSEITFDMVYNKVVAPYMNMYLQLAESAILTNNLNNSVAGGKFKARDAYTILHDSIQPDEHIHIVSDTGTSLLLDIDRNYTYNSQTFTITKRVEYLYQQYTDYERINGSLCEPYKRYKNTEGAHTPQDKFNISFRNTVPIDSNNNYDIVEDYIGYLKNCTKPTWDDNLKNYISRETMVIPYKVTTLDAATTSTDNTTYGFATFNTILNQQSEQLAATVDEYARYTNKYNKGNTSSNQNYSEVYHGVDGWNVVGGDQNVLLHTQPGFIQNVAIRMDNFVPQRNSSTPVYPGRYTIASDEPANMSINYVITDSGIQYLVNPFKTNYSLWMNAHRTLDYAGQKFGLSGFNIEGNSQGWSVCMPMTFRLYKDGQNFLNGRYLGTSHHGGIYVDYKLPNDITEGDFWFANSWISSVRYVGIWDIESGATSYPSATDGMNTYLHRRNHTLFDVDKLYNVDASGNYQSMAEYIEHFIQIYVNQVQDKIEQQISDIEDNINNQPSLDYVEFPKDDMTGSRLCQEVSVNGLANNITRLKQFVNDSSAVWSANTSNGTTIYIVNNKYYNISNYTSDNLTIKPVPQPQIESSVANFSQRYVLNTTEQANSDSVLKTTVRLKRTNGNSITLTLETILNQFIQDSNDYIDVEWKSNYPLIYDDVNKKYTTTILNYDNNAEVDCLIEITVMPKSLTGDKTATGYCNIKIMSESTSISPADVNYLCKALAGLQNVTWEQVSSITRSGLAPKLWKLGDTKSFKVTDNGTTYNIQAMIIGFDVDNVSNGEHSITWLTNIYNDTDSPNILDSTLFNKKFNHKLLSTSSCNIYGYDHYNTNTNKFSLDVLDWLNGDILSNTDSTFLSIVSPVCKTNGIAYTCGKDDVYGVVKTATDTNNGIVTSISRQSMKFWLPSLSEIGLKFTTDDIVEQYFVNDVTPPDDTRRKSTPISFRNCIVKEVNDEGINDKTCVYPYFQQALDDQNIKSLTLLTSSYYDVNVELTSGTVDDFVNAHKGDDVTSPDFTNIYNSVSRYQYVVGASYTQSHLNSRFFEILHKEDVATVLNGEVYTDFCFVTK